MRGGFKDRRKSGKGRGEVKRGSGRQREAAPTTEAAGWGWKTGGRPKLDYYSFLG